MSWKKSLRNRSRLLARGVSAVYHVVNRAALQSMILDDEAKAVFVRQMWRQAAFAGVEVLSYCVMTNHFHILVRIPKPADLTDTELMRRYRILYGEHCPHSAPEPDVMEHLLKEGGSDADVWRRRLHARMHRLSPFISELKQRFSIWFNKHRDNRGTVWSERFKSLIIEDNPEYTAPIAAYIDLNPVRAQMVSDPSDYLFSNYGQLMRGNRSASLASLYQGSLPSLEALKAYRVLLFGKGRLAKTQNFDSTGKIDSLLAETVLRRGGALSWAEVLKIRIGYFTRGSVLGSTDFVQGFRKPGRESSSLGRIEIFDSDFRSLRNLRKRPLG